MNHTDSLPCHFGRLTAMVKTSRLEATMKICVGENRKRGTLKCLVPDMVSHVNENFNRRVPPIGLGLTTLKIGLH